MHREIIACIVIALMAQAGWAEGETASCGIESGSDTDYIITPCNVTNNEVFNMVVIGDSIAWGNGLNKKNKYPYHVADWLQGKLNRPVEVKVYAHSGATISGEPGKSIDPNLNSGTPTLMDQAKSINNKDKVDLILVSGGINDVGIGNILDANTPAETINTLSESIRDPMMNLLTYLLTETNAKIIVTGYYPLITEESKVEIQDRAVAGALALKSEKTVSQSENVLISAIADPTAAKLKAAGYLVEGIANNFDNFFEEDGLLRANSDTFYAISTNSLENAAKDADKGQNRIKFVDPLFGRMNSYRASNSFLWELNGDDLKTNDFQYQERSELVEKTYAFLDLIKRFENKINPIAHPNRKGAAKYADAIKAAIDDKGLSWLDNSPPTIQLFQVAPLGLTAGESFSIDYTVSDIGGSGLKQVELWRKDETSNWQEITTNTLAGENGPLSGSFTDSPAAPGKYWYGVHVVDNAGNWNDEMNSNINNPTANFEPIVVEIVDAKIITPKTLLDNSSEQVVAARSSSQAPSEEWNRTFGGPDDDWANFVQPTDDGGYILAGGANQYDSISSSLWICKADIEGNEIWNRTITVRHPVYDLRCSVQAYSVIPTSDNGYLILAGWPESGIPGGGFLYAWLIKFDPNGKGAWNKTLGERAYHSLGKSIQLTSDGGYILAGVMKGNAWLVKTDSNGNEIWSRILGTGDAQINSVRLTLDGGYILAGNTRSQGAGRTDAWLIKTDSEGNEVWNKTFGGKLEDEANCVLSMSDDGYILTGKTRSFGNGHGNAWLISTDSEGNEFWNRTLTGEGCSEANLAQSTPDGNYILGGWTKASEYSGPDNAWLIKTDSEGNEIWSKILAGGRDNSINSIQLTPEGGYILAGVTESLGAGGEDAWLIKLAPG
jgi:lysophospholipase L1-like esterase